MSAPSEAKPSKARRARRRATDWWPTRSGYLWRRACKKAAMSAQSEAKPFKGADE